MLLITGSNGQLGHCLAKEFPNAILAGKDVLDITDAKAVSNFIKVKGIDTIINCAAYTAVDAAEDDPLTARQVNVLGASYLARTSAKIIHISTDYVFDGKKSSPYSESDLPNPLNVYGKTKFVGEQALLKYAQSAIVIRVGWLYSPYCNNFLKTIKRLGSNSDVLRVIADQIGTPTSAIDLAGLIRLIIPALADGISGVYHFSNEGVASWYDFARKICKLLNLNCDILPIESKDYPQKAKRPSFSILNKSKIKNDFNVSISHWEEALEQCISQF